MADNKKKVIIPLWRYIITYTMISVMSVVYIVSFIGNILYYVRSI